MKDTTKLKLAALCLGLAAAVLTIGWTQIISQMTGPYGHTITDGASGFTITGTTTPDSVAAKKVIVTTTTGDSTIIITKADTILVISSINGARDTLKLSADLLEWSGGITLPQSKAITCGNISSVGGVYSLLFRNIYTNATNADLRLWGAVGTKYMVALGYPDSTKGVVIDSTGFRIKASGSTHISGIYTGNATGWTLENTVDTNVVSGATATSRIGSLTLRAASATLTAPLTGRTVVDTLFINCAAADTAAVRAASVDWTIFK